MIRVRPAGPVCHKGTDTCWGEANEGLGFLNRLDAVIKARKSEWESGSGQKSYVASLFEKGINKMAQKVGEEAVETVIEAMDDQDDLFLNESADLLFHLMVLVQAKGFSLADVVSMLETRHEPSR